METTLTNNTRESILDKIDQLKSELELKSKTLPKIIEQNSEYVQALEIDILLLKSNINVLRQMIISNSYSED